MSVAEIEKVVEKYGDVKLRIAEIHGYVVYYYGENEKIKVFACGDIHYCYDGDAPGEVMLSELDSKLQYYEGLRIVDKASGSDILIERDESWILTDEQLHGLRWFKV